MISLSLAKLPAVARSSQGAVAGLLSVPLCLFGFQPFFFPVMKCVCRCHFSPNQLQSCHLLPRELRHGNVPDSRRRRHLLPDIYRD